MSPYVQDVCFENQIKMSHEAIINEGNTKRGFSTFSTLIQIEIHQMNHFEPGVVLMSSSECIADELERTVVLGRLSLMPNMAI